MKVGTESVLQGDILEIQADDGVTLRTQVLGSSTGPRLVVGHGNGLASSGYKSFWSQLLDDYQVVLFDIRGHGISESGDMQNHSWQQFVIDFETVMQALRSRLGERTTFGAFHSLSSLVSVCHAREYGMAFERLVLFDPPLIPADDNPLQKAHIDEMMDLAQRVARRREQFDDWRELAEQLKSHPMFARCQPQACDELAHALLRPVIQDDTTVWRLSCPPTFEAKIFASNDDTTLWPWLPTLGDKVKLICADPDVPGVQPSAPIGREMCVKLGIPYAYVPDTTHFLQLENPDACAAHVREFCRT